jgi:NAD(P)-dependent dehydrogenase (short-subunit alcohol dehydrogenase family)
MNLASQMHGVSSTVGGLLGKVAIVTGASRGIGRAVAQGLAREGARVMLTARDAAKLNQAVAEIECAGGKAACAVLDLQEPAAPGLLVERTIATFGAIDIVINNAGATKRGEFLDLTDEDWCDGFALKFFGAVRLVKAAWPYLKSRKGSILNIAGIGGRSPGPQFAIGGSVNAALLSLTKALADLGIQDGVQVNAVNPGPVRTNRLIRRLEVLAMERGIDVASAADLMVKEARVTRLGEPEDIAHLITFIVSPQGKLLQGALIDMDGGSTKTI